ncbi:MAG: DNA polymerase III subunit delta [uncultured Campylobacterales bacterium]|uniref:DNA polymerase III subunit delta n=1 Tax=uncultured Campylobacterales bacterium TaxID=352960 RepID=A0A6S6SV26_9BACT|nr:MAG: DNA polymerase III subunit delta [uncultured Campylobacterales bacterium]
MYSRDLDRLITQNKLPNSFLIYGQSEYLRDTYTNKILGTYKDENIVKLYFDEYDFALSKRHLSQESLFGGMNILLIKTDKNIPAKEIKSLIQVCAKTDNSKLIVEYFGDDTKAKKFQTPFGVKNKANFLRVFKPNLYEAITILSAISKEIEIVVDKYTLEYLYEVENGSLAKSINSLKKLKSVSEKQITKKEIDKYIYGTSTIDLELLVQKLFDKQDILKYLEKIISNQTHDNLDILRAINKYFHSVFLFHLYIKINGKVDVKDILGYNLPPDISNKISVHSLKIKNSNINKILSILCECELGLKSTAENKTSILISSLIKLQSFL